MEFLGCYTFNMESCVVHSDRLAASENLKISKMTPSPTEPSPTFATGAAGMSKMAENRLLTLKGLHQTHSLSSSPF